MQQIYSWEPQQNTCTLFCGLKCSRKRCSQSNNTNEMIIYLKPNNKFKNNFIHRKSPKSQIERRDKPNQFSFQLQCKNKYKNKICHPSLADLSWCLNRYRYISNPIQYQCSSSLHGVDDRMIREKEEKTPSVFWRTTSLPTVKVMFLIRVQIIRD